MAKTTGLYGFSPSLGPFMGASAASQAELLRSWGTTAVFGGYQDRAFVAAARDAGIAVYAEFGCFVGAELWQRFPTSRPVLPDGTPMEPDGPYWGVNPAAQDVREDRLDALEALLTEYDVDGVWLDFIRWPCHWEVPEPDLVRTSFDLGTLARFSADTGTRLTKGETARVSAVVLEQFAQTWTAWRCHLITSWVAKARTLIDGVRPGAVLGLFGVPWRLADYDGAILNVIGQDYRALGRYVDVFSPMVYHAMCGFEALWIDSVAREVHALTEKPVWPIIQSVDVPRSLPAAEYAQALDIALQSTASAGVLVYKLDGALEAHKLEATRERFLRAQHGES